ncbi:MAG: hypothetical protein GQF41_3088 [Candidatus Rifleibacterium amylolyticum]|nr:MAG: hypothetical protein GQF41_3088 [Candidatus Rifleibacterium amylolyticum]
MTYQKYVFLLLLSGALLLPGCFDFTGSHRRKRDELSKELTLLREELRRSATVLDVRDQLKQELAITEYKLDRLRRAQQELQEKGHE